MGSVQFQIVPCSSLYFFSRSINLFQCLVSANYRVLICCTCHCQSGFLFVIFFFFFWGWGWASSLFRSLQHLISALTQGGEGGHLFGLTCSVCCGEGETQQTNITGVWECSQCMDHTGFAPCSQCMCFHGLHCSGFKLLSRGTVQSRPWVSCTSQV